MKKIADFFRMVIVLAGVCFYEACVLFALWFTNEDIEPWFAAHQTYRNTLGETYELPK